MIKTARYFLTALFCTSLVSAAPAQNLLVHGNGETSDLSGWVDADAAWGVSGEVPPHNGTGFIWPRMRAIALTQLYQDVNLAAYEPELSAGRLNFHLTGWLANYNQYPYDQATLAIQGLDAAGQQMFYFQRSHRNPQWTEYTIESGIPASTRSLRVLLMAQRFVGTDNDAYFDDLSLAVDTNPTRGIVLVTAVGGAAEVAVGGTLQLTAVTVGTTNHTYQWSSSFNAVATVDTNGLVSATESGHITIQAVDMDSGAIGSLEVVAFNPKDVIFTHPVSGAQWEAGTIETIAWNSKGSLGPRACYYRLAPDLAWIKIADVTDEAVASLPWTTPLLETAANQAALRMTWSGGESVSPEFALVPGPVAPTLNLDLSSPGAAVISLRGRIGRSYQLQTTSDLDGGKWTNAATISLSKPTAEWVDENMNQGGEARFYRAILTP